MKIRSLIAGALVAVILVGAAAFAAPQGRIFFDLPFQFSAGEFNFAAGRYEIELGTPGQFSMTLRNTATGSPVIVPLTSRLAARNVGMPELVFDQAEGHNCLSEIHLPGMDGYFLAGAKGPHTHKIIQGTK